MLAVVLNQIHFILPIRYEQNNNGKYLCSRCSSVLVARRLLATNLIRVSRESAEEVRVSLRLLQVDELALHNLHWCRRVVIEGQSQELNAAFQCAVNLSVD